MTYNVKGLPWPVALDRPARLARIGSELAALRREGRHPQILVLQEAFVQEAKAIGGAAGYRYVAYGPTAAMAPQPSQPSLGPDFVAAASPLKGEGLGKVLDGGLVIFSDYPIEDSAAIAFPQDACAGFDCLAAKGVQLARIRVPGQREPLTLVNTHLNADVSSSGVGIERTDAAFAWQYAAIQRLVARHVKPDELAIFAGDFNIGPGSERWMRAQAIGMPLSGAREALDDSVERGIVNRVDAAAAKAILNKRIDRIYYRFGASTGVSLRRLSVPFHTGTATSLSDHAGFVASFTLL